MKKLIRVGAALVALFSWSTAFVHGQEDQVRAEIRFFLWSSSGKVLWSEGQGAQTSKPEDDGSKEFLFAKGKEFESVKCAPDSYSVPMTYVGSRKFQLFQAGSGNANGSAAAPIAEAMLPPGSGRYILFLDGSATAPRILVFPYDAGSVAKGQMMLFNATDRALGVRVGKEQKAVSPKAVANFSVSTFTDYQMPLEIFEKNKNDWQMKISMRRAIVFNERNLGVLYQRPNDKEVAFTLLPPIVWEAKQP